MALDTETQVTSTKVKSKAEETRLTYSTESWDFDQQPHRWRWPLRIAIVAVILVALGGAGVGVQRFLQRQSSEKLLDLTVPVSLSDLTQRLRVSGQVQPIRQVNVSPRESGRLLELYVEQGDVVQAGQLLARMDYGDLDAGRLQAEARIAELEAQLLEQQAGERSETIAAAAARVEAAQAQVDQAQREVERFQTLRLEGVISQNEIDTRLTTLRQAEADRDAAQKELERLQAGTRSEDIQQTQAQIRQAQAQLQEQLSRIADTEVRAPFGGIVLQRFADLGAFVTPTTTASEATAASSSSILSLAEGIEVRADVPETQIRNVEVGQTVEIRPVAFPDEVIQGQVKRIAPSTVVVREVTIFRVIITPIGEQIPEDGTGILRTGMNVSVDFVGEELPEALTVPSVSVVYQDNQTGVILWDPDQQKPVYQLIETGISQAGLTQIMEGLESNDRIFTSLPPGASLERLMTEAEAANPQAADTAE